MNKLVKENESLALKTYLKMLCDYCNKYDNIAILNLVRAFVGDNDISLADVYADFELVSKDEYDRGNPFSMENRNSVETEKLIREIDKKIYQLQVKEAIDKSYTVIKKSLYVYVVAVGKNVIECLLKKNPEDTKAISKKIYVKGDIGYTNSIKRQWVWIRGYEVIKPDENYFLLEPYWYKANTKLTKEDKDFFESDLIIEKNESFDKEIKEVNEEANIHINGMVVLSEPGGGKTTYLKHLIYEIALSTINKEVLAENTLFEKSGLDKNLHYIPIFVRTRDVADILSNNKIEKECLFDTILERCIKNIITIADECVKTQLVSTIICIIKNKLNYKMLFIIDGFEELDDEKAGRLLECIEDAYDSGNLDRREDKLIISSRYKEYGYQKLVTFCMKHSIEEKYISFEEEKINVCVSKWFDILKKTGQDNKEYFNLMRTSNSDIGKLITTPLELTGLIMLCQSQSALPTDITVLYRSIIEIWLTHGIKDAGIPFFSLSDIFLELSSIAYYMAEADDQYRINRDTIRGIIEERRSDLRRYYRSNAYVDAASREQIDELIDFWLKRNILVKKASEDIYEFAHREYQSYLISYAIVNNFIPKNKRKEKRIEYFREHMEHAEDFWDRVIIFSAFLSTDLHDAIIDHIFERLQNIDAQDTGIVEHIDVYFLSIILQLANAEGFYFADYEYELLFKELFKNDRINIMKKSVKGSEIKKLLSNGRKEINNLFLKQAIETIEKCNEDIERLKKNGSDFDLLELRKKEKSNIINRVGSLVFHVIWNCDADKDMIKRAFYLYLDNWITMEMIYEIKESIASYCYNADRVTLINEIGREAITRNREPMSDGYMIISIILAFKKSYEEDGISLYGVALDYFNKAENSVDATEKLETIIIAINIVFLTTWFIQDNEARKCGCDLREIDGNWNAKLLEEYEACVAKIVEHLKMVEDNSIYKRDIYASYRDLCRFQAGELREKIEPLLLDKEILRKCISSFDNERIVKKENETELSYVFEIVALYPLIPEYMNLSELRSQLNQKIDEIENCRMSKKTTARKEIYLLKLLIFAGAFEENGKVNVTKLGTEIDQIRTKYDFIGAKFDRDMLESMKAYRIALLNRNNYEDLMILMDKKISEL